jgi:hypothetical protein
MLTFQSVLSLTAISTKEICQDVILLKLIWIIVSLEIRDLVTHSL